MNRQEQAEPPAAGFVAGDRVRHSFSKEVTGKVINSTPTRSGYDYFVQWDDPKYGATYYTASALELVKPQAEDAILMSDLPSQAKPLNVKKLVLAKQIEALEEVQAAYDQKLDPWDAIHKMGELIQLKKKELGKL
jgi:hypothetical protein